MDEAILSNSSDKHLTENQNGLPDLLPTQDNNAQSEERDVNWRAPKNATTSSAEKQGLDYDQPNKAETESKGSGITPQNSSSTDKGSNNQQENNSLEKADTVGYSVKPAQYTRKDGSILDMQLVEFDRKLSKKEYASAISLSKSLRGWRDKATGGFMMRSEEDAQTLINTIIDESGEAVADAAPLSLEDSRKLVPTEAKEDKGLNGQEIPNQENESNHIVAEPKNEGQFGLVSDERMEELKRKLKEKLSQLNLGADPEMLLAGMELSLGYIDRGIKGFADFAKKMISDFGDAIRSYLKAFYEGAKNLPEAYETGLIDEMTQSDDVQKFDVAGFDKPTKSIIAQAEQISAEEEVQRQADDAEKQLKEKRNEERKRSLDKLREKSLSSQVGAQDISNEFENQKKRQESVHLDQQEDSSDSNQKQDTNNTKEDETVRLRPFENSSTERRGGQPRVKNDTLGEVERSQDEDLDGERLDRGLHSHSADDEVRDRGVADISKSVERLPIDQSKKQTRNTNNNRIKKGEVVVPQTDKARFDANIEAIKLCKQLIEDGVTVPTKAQMQILRQYSGWGGLGSYFNSWAKDKENQALKSLLTPDEYDRDSRLIL